MSAKSHGLSRDSNGDKTYIYRAWSSMKQRCYNPKAKGFELYGGRGITVCARWLKSFESFYEDMGERPSEYHSLDRRRNNEGYCKENCRWATKQEQSLNQRDRKRVCRKTDALLLQLVPQLSRMGFSMRNIALLFSIGKTTVEKILAGSFDSAEVVDGKVFVVEKRKQNSISRIRRVRSGS